MTNEQLLIDRLKEIDHLQEDEEPRTLLGARPSDFEPKPNGAPSDVITTGPCLGHLHQWGCRP